MLHFTHTHTRIRRYVYTRAWVYISISIRQVFVALRFTSVHASASSVLPFPHITCLHMSVGRHWSVIKRARCRWVIYTFTHATCCANEHVSTSTRGSGVLNSWSFNKTGVAVCLLTLDYKLEVRYISIWKTNSPLNCVYLHNGDNIEKKERER